MYWVNRTPLAKLIQDQTNANKLNYNAPKYMQPTNPKKKEYKNAAVIAWRKLLRSLLMPSSTRTEEVLGKSSKDRVSFVKIARDETTNDGPKFETMSEAAEVADAMRRRSKKNSAQFNESLDKKSVGKRRFKRWVSEKALTDTTESGRSEEREVGRQAENTEDVRTGEKLTVNAADLNFNAAPLEPNRDVTNTEHMGFKIVIPPPIPRRHKYVPIFRDCNKKDHTPEQEAVTNISAEITNGESKQPENGPNYERTSLNLSTEPESREQSYEEVDKTVEFIKVNDSDTTQSQEAEKNQNEAKDREPSHKDQEENNRHDVSGVSNATRDSDKSSQIRVSTDSSTEENSNDESSEQSHTQNLKGGSEEEVPNTRNNQEKEVEEEESEAKLTEPEEPKLESLLFDINEYTKPFDLDEFLANDPIFKRIGIPATEKEGETTLRNAAKQNSKLTRSNTNSANSKEDYQEENTEDDSSIEEETGDAKDNRNSHKELKDEDVENNSSDEDFLLSFLNRRKSSSPRQKATMPHEDEREFLSRYFTKDVIEKLRERSTEDEGAKDDGQQEEIYNTLSGILKKRGRTPSFSEELREKKKEEGKSPRAYKSFWSLEYASPHAEAATAEGEEA